MFKKIMGGLALSIALSTTAQAGNVSGRTIEGTGCDSTGTCFMNLSGAAFGPSACQSRQIRFDGTTAAGKSLYASVLSAKLSGSDVRVGFSDTVCSGPTPTLTFLTLL